MTEGAILVYGTAWCGDCRRAKRLLGRRNVPYRWIDIDADPAAEVAVLRLNRGLRSVPTIRFPDGSLLVEPSDRALDARLATISGPATGSARPLPDRTNREPWRARAFAGGLLGSLVASLCCLPAALALALGLSLGTAAALSRLLAFQPVLQLAGLLVAGIAAWRMAVRRGAACAADSDRRVGAPIVVFVAFVVGYVLLDLALIPFLERLPWLLAGK